MRNIYKRSRIAILREVLNDPDRKPLLQMLWELLALWWYHREMPVHYVSRYLFKKEARNIYDYIPNKLAGQIAPSFNDKRFKQVLDNKLYFNLYYSQFGIITPRIIAFNHRNMFAAGGKMMTIKDVGGFKDILSELFRQNPECDALFLKRTYSSSSGKNIHIIPAGILAIDDPELNMIFKEVISSEFVFQQRVKQHPELNRLNPASLNTMRIDTFIDGEGNIDIISAFLKMSTNSLPVDNNTSGGCGVGIDLNTGKLKKNAYSKIKICGTGILTGHPVTGVRFEDFTVPKFEEAKKLVIEAAGLSPGLRLIGWDVGIGETSPIIIEGNSDYGINSNDLMYGGYMGNETFNKVLRELKNR